MGLLLIFGTGLQTTSVGQLFELTGITRPPTVEDDDEVLEFFFETWDAIGTTDSLSRIQTEDYGVPFFPRSRDGLDLHADYAVRNNVGMMNWGYDEYGTSFRRLLLFDAVNLASELGADASGEVAKSVLSLGTYPLTLGHMSRHLGEIVDPNGEWNTAKAKSCGAPLDKDPYDVIPFLDWFNFPDNEGLIGPVGVERLNRSMDWLESYTNDRGTRVLDFLLANSETLDTAKVRQTLTLLRRIRGQNGAHILYA